MSQYEPDDRDQDISESVESIARQGLTGSPEQIVKDYVKEIILLQLRYAELQREIQNISTGWIGFCCRKKLADKGCKLNGLLDRTTRVQSAVHDTRMLTEISTDSPDEISDTAQEQLKTIRSNGLYQEVERVEALREEASRLYQHKLDTANTQLGLFVSLLAVVIAAISLGHTFIT